MSDRLSGSIAIATPPLVGFLSIGYGARSILQSDPKGKIYEVEVGLLTLPIPQDAIHSALLIMVGLALLYLTLVRNYATILPSQLRFDVYFDQEGMERLVKGLPKSSLADVLLPTDWKTKTTALHVRLTRLLRQRIGVNVDSRKINQISAKGITTFIVEKEAEGFQRYRICEVDGYLLFDIPTKMSFLTMRSFFSLNSSQRDRFSVGLMDMMVHFRFLLSPLLRQTYVSTPGTEFVLEDVIAVTWVRFLPLISIGNTLYLARDGDAHVPIGYCSYKL
jgi:hypothetical protein